MNPLLRCRQLEEPQVNQGIKLTKKVKYQFHFLAILNISSILFSELIHDMIPISITEQKIQYLNMNDQSEPEYMNL